MSDALVMSGRSLRLGRRNLDALLTSLLLPIMLMPPSTEPLKARFLTSSSCSRLSSPWSSS